MITKRMFVSTLPELGLLCFFYPDVTGLEVTPCTGPSLDERIAKMSVRKDT